MIEFMNFLLPQLKDCKVILGGGFTETSIYYTRCHISKNDGIRNLGIERRDVLYQDGTGYTTRFLKL
jgi:hypothetical protein